MAQRYQRLFIPNRRIERPHFNRAVAGTINVGDGEWPLERAGAIELHSGNSRAIHVRDVAGVSHGSKIPQRAKVRPRGGRHTFWAQIHVERPGVLRRRAIADDVELPER